MKLGQKIAVNSIRIKFSVLTFFSKRKAAREAVRLFCTPQLRVRRKLPQLFTESEKLQFSLNGAKVHGYRWNHSGNRKALVLHGFDSSVTNFEQYVRALLEKGYEVLAFDAPAHGRSKGDIITVPLYRDMILYIHDHYGPVHSFLGHSMGGLALSLAMEKIIHDDNTRIALIAPATESTTAIDNFFKFLRIGDKQVRMLFDKFILELTGHPASWFSITRAMQQIHAKVLWVHDENDAITPLRDTYEIKEQNYPGVKFVITHGLGHRRIYRDEKVVESVIAFL